MQRCKRFGNKVISIDSCVTMITIFGPEPTFIKILQRQICARPKRISFGVAHTILIETDHSILPGETPRPLLELLGVRFKHSVQPGCLSVVGVLV